MASFEMEIAMFTDNEDDEDNNMCIDACEANSKYYVMLPGSVYSGIIQGLFLPQYFFPMYNAIESLISETMLAKEIGVIIAGYLCDLQFTCDDEIVQYVIKHCQHHSHNRVFCERNSSHFGNCTICMERYGLRMECKRCNQPNCHVDCLECVDCNCTYCDICDDWHKAVRRCSICRAYKHWVHVNQCEDPDDICLNFVCTSCNLCKDGRVLCYFCDDSRMIRQ